MYVLGCPNLETQWVFLVEKLVCQKFFNFTLRFSWTKYILLSFVRNFFLFFNTVEHVHDRAALILQYAYTFIEECVLCGQTYDCIREGMY